MRRRTTVVAILLLSVTALVFGILWGAAEQRCKRAAAIADDLGGMRTTNSALRDSITLLTRNLARAREDSSLWYEQMASLRQNQGMLLDDIETRRLKKMGLRDPVSDLRRDLLAHPELIPYEGVLGGRMAFLEYSVILLSTRWAFAEFEDGHIQGRCLLTYEVAPDGRISWKVLSAMLD